MATTAKKKLSKRFRIATEGATTDGRTISREWLEQMARNYDPKKYGARVNLEHIRSLLPDSPFRAYGDVVALETEEVDGKLHLLAQIDPTEDLLKLNQARQKVYTSMEVDLDFAGSGEAYLVGLAVTDSPASLGTEMLQFSAKAENSPLAARKQRPENLFSAAVEAELEFIEQEATTEERPSLLDSVKAMFTRHKKAQSGDQAKFRDDLEATLGMIAEKFNELRDDLEQKKASQDEFSALKTAFDELKGQFTTLRTQLDNEPGHTTPRSPASGSDGRTETDC